MAQSIKLGSDTYIDESNVMLDSSSTGRKTIAQARSPVSFSLTYSFTPGNESGNCYYDPLTREVHIDILLYSADRLIPGATAVIATIPSAYRPTALIQTFAIVSKSDYSIGQVEGVNIFPDGSILCRNFLAGTAMKVFALKVTYKI